MTGTGVTTRLAYLRRARRRVLLAGQERKPLEWHDFADAWLDIPLGRVLDYGCGDGTFLGRIANRATECHGVDIDQDCVNMANRRPGIHACCISPHGSLPFRTESFDTALALEVIEHVASERRVLTELARVLRPGGMLLLTAPHHGLLTFLDPGNVKFITPRLHRFIHVRLLQQPEYYERRFGTQRQCQRHLLADFCLDHAAWHRHYTYEQLRRLAPAELQTVAHAVYYPGYRALGTVRLALRVITRGRSRGLPRILERLNRRLSHLETRWGDQLVALFTKGQRSGGRLHERQVVAISGD